MDQEFVNFVSERRGNVEDFLSSLRQFQDELRGKVKELATLIDLGDYADTVYQGTWRERTSLSDYLYHDIRFPDNVRVAIDTIISPQGWEIQIFPRRRGDRTRVRDLLRRLEIPVEEENRFIYVDRFGFNENLDEVRSVLQGLIDTLATESRDGDWS